MSCHDGSAAVDKHNGASAGDSGALVTGSAAVGLNNDLSDDHPVGFKYSDAYNRRGSQELVDMNQRFATAISLSSTAGVYDNVVRSGNRRIRDVLYSGDIVTCSSCHEVHNCDNVKPDPGHSYNYLLWAKEEHSLICLSCHIK
jgi:hypothetical protein